MKHSQTRHMQRCEPKQNRKRSLLLWIVCCICVTSLQAKEIFVDKKQGNDLHPGTKEAPLATLHAARNLIRHYKSIEKQETSYTVTICGGTYELSEPLVLNELDKGTALHPVIWRAADGETVRISGGRTIPATAFKPVSNAKVKSKLTTQAARHVVVANLKALGITDYGSESQYGHALSVTNAPMELFVNDKAMTVARYPNEGFIKIGKVIDSGSVPRTGDYSERGGEFHFTDPRHSKWVGLNDVWFQGSFNYGFADDNLEVEYIDPKKKSVKMKKPHLYGLAGGSDYQQYYAKNILCELDSINEWYIDKTNGLLYLWAPENLTADTQIKVSILEEPIICLEGAEEVTIENITVEHGRGIGIYMERCSHVTIAGCTVRNIGTNGIFMGQGARQSMSYITHDHYEGVPMSRFVGNLQGHIYKYTHWDRQSGSNNKILSCDVYSTGSGGIYLSGGSKAKLIPGNSVVENCKITDYNRRNKFLWAGINIDGCGNRVAHCEIYNSDWQAMYVHGNDHVFEYNDIHHVTQNSNDTSPWYIGRDPSDRGNIVRYNYFHHCGNPNRMTMGVYCDDSSTDVLIHGNIFNEMNTHWGMLFSNTGWDLRFINNIVIKPLGHTVVISNHYYTWAAKEGYAGFNPDSGYLHRRLTQNVNIYAEPYASRYPLLGDYLNPIVENKEWEGMRSKRNVAARNVIVGSKLNPLQLTGEYAQCEWIDNVETDNDPGFEDMSGSDFRLKQDSELFKLIPNFEAVPFDKMGLYQDQYRK